MINYAWANPTTGVREQAATLEEARFEVWKELQASPNVEAPIYEQERAGIVSPHAATLEIQWPWDAGYAYASPLTGERFSVSGWATVVEEIRCLYSYTEDPPDFVVVYRQRLATTVFASEAQPSAPAAPLPPPPDTPASLIQQVQDGTCFDLNRAQILAMLWIAEALQHITAAMGPTLQVPSPIPSTWKAPPHIYFERDLSKGANVCAICGLPVESHPNGSPAAFS